MAHLLVLELPGGNDFAVMQEAFALGHTITFCTSDLETYRKLGTEAEEILNQTQHLVEIPRFQDELLFEQLDTIHAKEPFEAVLCIVDIRLKIAALVAQRYGLKFLSPDVVTLTRNKTAVRNRLKEKGIPQPGFASAANPEELWRALEQTGYPAVVKPSDGYGSENLYYFEDAELVSILIDTMFAGEGANYGLGVYSNRIYSVEPYMKGQLIGVDVFCDGTERVMLGVNAKKMFPPPSFAILGSCFPAKNLDLTSIQKFAYAVLDAIEFDFGACHIEIILHNGKFYLVEVNARLVSAQIPFQMSYAFERSIYADLISLHLGVPLQKIPPFKSHLCSVIRWLVSKEHGIIEEMVFPDDSDPAIRRIIFFKKAGDEVKPPLANGDRIGYVIATASTEAKATEIAENYIHNITLRVRPCDS